MVETGTRTVINNDSDAVIEVKNLYKSFKLPKERAYGIKQAIFYRLRGIKGYKKQEVLKKINLKVKKGDFLGIVGRNGSGKSTLLKILAGVYYPEKGQVVINGNLIPFIELGVGFNPELSGRDNVYLNGALLGFSNKEVDEMYDEIVEFAELKPFMDQKLKNFSSGMQVRLAFSIAIKAKGDILVLDEVLAVGDEAFQNKCNQYFNKIKKDKTKTVILVTHSMESVRKFCNRAVLIRDGVVKIDGSPEDVANSYSLENAGSYSNQNSDFKDHKPSAIDNLKVTLRSKNIISERDKVIMDISYDTTQDIRTYAAITLWDIVRGQSLVNSNSKEHLTSGKKHQSITFETSLEEVNDVNIRAYVSIRDQDGTILAYSLEEGSPTFIVRRDDYKDPNNRTVDAVLFNRGKYKNHAEKTK